MADPARCRGRWVGVCYRCSMQQRLEALSKTKAEGLCRGKTLAGVGGIAATGQ